MVALSRKQVLVTRVDTDTFRRVSELLRPTEMEIHHASWDSTTLELVQTTAFDVIIIGYPVSPAALTRFLDTARAQASACNRAGLVLITEDEYTDAARSLLGRGANRVVSAGFLEGALLPAVNELASPAPRVPVRVPARIKLFADGRPLRIMAQIENMSSSGMLLRGVTQFPIGTNFDFEILIPNDATSITGTAEITRITNPVHETVHGVGVRFVSFGGSDRVRFEMFIDDHLIGRDRPEESGA
jgi:hypothetical protein